MPGLPLIIWQALQSAFASCLQDSTLHLHAPLMRSVVALLLPTMLTYSACGVDTAYNVFTVYNANATHCLHYL